VRVAIVGLGPKGLFALERLLDHAHDLPAFGRLEVDAFEPHPAPGAGPVYDPHQPDYLRMNFAAAALDLWWPSSRAAPGARRRSFVAWRSARDGGDEDYPPRGEVGRYLGEGLETLLRYAPANVEVRLQRARVESVRAGADGWRVEATGARAGYDEVLVAIGHEDTSPDALAGAWTHAAPLVPAVFPVDRRLTRDRVPPGSTVAIRGFALTFIDAALALTEGRGGSFEPLGHHPYLLRYVPGADDAGRILPFTRSGRPMLAKPGRALAAGTPWMRRIAEDGRAQLTALPRPLDLERDVEPILGSVVDAILTGMGSSEPASSSLLDPAGAIERSLAVGAGLIPPDREWALGHAWRALYPAIVSQLGGGGLAERDWPAFLRLAAEMERVAFGPPPVNAAKLLALVESGRVDLTHLCGGGIVSRDGQTLLESERGSRPVDVVVDAVLPGPGALGHGGLLADLIESGYARVALGRRGLDVAADGTCRDRDGALSHSLCAIGRPTEDSVIGNDTLSRGLHPHADRWAESVVRRCREHSRAARVREAASV
jgi:uncharacterized NAD(P)/FAD-binding protein YdhS